MRVRKSSGRVKRSLSRLPDELILFSFDLTWGERGKREVGKMQIAISGRTLLVRLLSVDVSKSRVSITRATKSYQILPKNLRMSDIQLNPPLRIQPTTAKNISAKSSQVRVSQFLDDYQQRHVSARTQGDKTIVAQLQKLADALTQEQAMRKTK